MTRFIALVATILLTTSSLEAVPITVPTDLNPGNKYRLAFVTSTTTVPVFLDIADYNTFVSGLANAVPELAALGTTWKAIGSTPDDDARDNTGTNPSSAGVPIYRLDNTRIADDNADLWDGSIQATLSTNQFGSPVGVITVWTGSSADGLAHINSSLGPPSAAFGFASEVDDRWIIQNTTTDFNFGRHLYAMSGELTVVPEPGTFSLLFTALGMVGVVSPARRQKVAQRC